MKVVWVAFLFAATAIAQTSTGSPTSACGPGTVKFKVKLDDAHATNAQIEPGKALVYFIHDSGYAVPQLGYPTTKMGVDGAWAGANHGNSFFSVSVEPGEHHVCATLQTSIFSPRAAFAHFSAEAGKVYYFRTQLLMSQSVELLELESVDGDEGRYLIAMYPMSVLQAKK